MGRMRTVSYWLEYSFLYAANKDETLLSLVVGVVAVVVIIEERTEKRIMA